MYATYAGTNTTPKWAIPITTFPPEPPLKTSPTTGPAGSIAPASHVAYRGAVAYVGYDVINPEIATAQRLRHDDLAEVALRKPHVAYRAAVAYVGLTSPP